LKKYLSLILVLLALLPALAHAGEESGPKNQAGLVVEYGLDSLERRYYHPTFHFDFPFRQGNFFTEVEYHSRMNGRLQGEIDYWVNVGVQRSLGNNLQLELGLNHFCRHRTVRNTVYIWNLNEVLGRVVLEGKALRLALGGGFFTGGSDDERYRELATAETSWKGFLIPELTLQAELKLVNFSRLYHDVGFSFALSPAVDIFFKNTRHYHYRNTSYLGLRFKSVEGKAAFLDTMRVLAGISPFDDMLKLEIEGEFKMEFFRNDSRRVAVAVDFEAPVLNGDGFFSQFWPWKMIYDIGLDYEKKIAPRLFAAWISQYRLDMPVDDNLPFVASLFTGLALRNQANFDELEQDVRYEAAVGYDFKRGLEFNGKLGLGVWSGAKCKVFSEIRTQADADRVRLDIRLLASGGGSVELRPYLGWKKDIGLDPLQETPGKFLFGLGFFKKF
jgi:hypothetical protein